MPAPEVLASEVYRQALAFAKDWGSRRNAFCSRLLHNCHLKPEVVDELFLTFAYTGTHRFVVKNLFQYPGAPFFCLDSGFAETFNALLLPVVHARPLQPGRVQQLVSEEIRQFEKGSGPGLSPCSSTLSFRHYVKDEFLPVLDAFEKTIESEQPYQHESKFEHQALWASARALQTAGLAFAAHFIYRLDKKSGHSGEIPAEMPGKSDRVILRYELERDLSPAVDLNQKAVLASPTASTWSEEWNISLHNIKEAYMNNRGDFFVTYIGGKLVAMGGLQKLDDDTAILKKVRVDPDFRRMGLAEELTALREERARELGYKKVVTELQRSNEPVIELYRKRGYEQVGESSSFGLDMLVFGKELGQPRP